MKKILLIITGSIAAYKSVELLRILQKREFDVSVVLTKAAQEFVTPLLVSSIAKNKIHTELFDDGDAGMSHIKLSRDNDLIIVAPASADFIAKMAGGYGDDLASTLILASNKKIMIAPAMNEKMWQNPANLRNIETLIHSGVILIEPTKDELACGEIGVGKMQEPTQIAKEIEDFFENRDKLCGKKILITGGATHEMIDSVRFIGNHSSGKQSIYLAKVLSEMGAQVTLVAGNIALSIPLPHDKIIQVKTADEMFAAVKNNLDQNDAFIACAAVADYKVENPTRTKIKKEESDNLTLNLIKNVDILDYVGHAENRPALVVGFAAESENITENAREKLLKKNCDFVIANDICDGRIFGNENSKAYFIDKNGEENLGEISKEKLAQIIANHITQKFQTQ